MEVLLAVFGELLKEKCKKSVNVLAGRDSIADRTATVGISDIYRLVEKDDGGVRVPRGWIIYNFQVLVDRRRTQFEEQACKRRASRTAVKPQYNWIIFRIVARLEEPYSAISAPSSKALLFKDHTVKQMFVILLII